MTVSSLVPVNYYSGNSSTTNFDFDFLIENESELVVKHINENGKITVLEYGVDYSIHEIGNSTGSYITFPLSNSGFDVLNSNEKISLSLDLVIKQESEFRNSLYFNFQMLEWTFDYIVRILQILARKVDLSVKIDETSLTTPDTLIEALYEAKDSAINSSQEASIASQNAIQAKNNSENTLNIINSKYQDFLNSYESSINGLLSTYNSCMSEIESIGIDNKANIALDNLSAAGESHFVKPTQLSNACDGGIVSSVLTIASDITYPTSSNSSYSLSNYLPNDNNAYMVWLVGQVTTGTTSGNSVSLGVSTDIIPWTQRVYICAAHTRSSSSVSGRGSCILPVGAERTINVLSASAATGKYSLHAVAYRRIGTNQ